LEKQIQYCNIISASIKSIGKNIDGILNDYNNGHDYLKPKYYKNEIDFNDFYYDTAKFDFGIITNTCKIMIKINLV
jgi:hypothetical protein